MVLMHHLTFTQVYDSNHVFWLIGPAWSLADEFHYYIIIAVLGPPLVRIAARRTTVARRLAVMATLPAVLLAASLTYTTIASYVMHVPFSSSWTYYNPLARVDSFAEGMLLAIALSFPGVMKARPKMATLLSGLGFAGIGVMWVARSHIPFLQVYYFAIIGAISLLMLTGATMLAPKQLLSKFLRSRIPQLWAVTGLSLYLLHEPIMLQLVKWHILNFGDKVAWPLSFIGLLAFSTLAGWITYKLIEEPGMRLQKLVADLKGRQNRAAPRRPGPPPRWLPDLVLATADGTPISLRDLPRDRPVLMAFEADGGRRLAEQRFRLDAREADGFYVTKSQETNSVPHGTTILVDADDRLTTALNGTAALIEVSPAGLITGMHEASATATT
jgi:peptidoglycan/LPS O-acetylase OafA/YrhL